MDGMWGRGHVEGVTEVSGWVAGWEHTSEREKLEGLCQAWGSLAYLCIPVT